MTRSGCTFWSPHAILVWGLVAVCVGAQPLTAQGLTLETAPAQASSAAAVRDGSLPDARAFNRLALSAAYLSQGQLDAALDESRKAVTLRPGWAEAHGLQALIHAARGRGDLAEQSFRTALQLAPEQAELHHNVGWFLCRQGRMQEAARHFQAALSQPGYAEAAKTLEVQRLCASTRSGGHDD